MSTKVLAQDLKIGDSLIADYRPIDSWSRQSGTLKGLINRVIDQMVNNKIYKYVEVYTDAGLKGAYFAFTDEVIKDIMPKEEAEFLMARNLIRNLPRVVDNQGSDPEMFVVNGDGIVIPSFKFLGSKKEPTLIPENRQTMFWDGYQAEFNIPAQSCLDGTLVHFYYGLKHLNKLAKDYDKGAKLTILPTMDIPPHMLREDKDEHVEFGCMPSKNAYGMSGRKEDGRNVPFRSAGGHIHLQLRDNQKKRVEEYVKALDAILGVACVGLFGAFDDPRRRELYGLAGEYRTPPHGLEYRPLSNVWLCHPTITYIVFEMARKIISLVDSGAFKHWKADERDTIAAINDCNLPLACELIKQNEDMFRDLLMSFCYQDKKKVDAVYNMIMTGVENYVDEVDNVEKNWNLLGSCNTSTSRISEMHNKTNFKKLLEIKF